MAEQVRFPAPVALVKRDWGDLTLQYDPIFADPMFEHELFDFVKGLSWGARPVFFDVGAHQGIWTTFLSRLDYEPPGRFGTVYSFEPHPNNVQFLSQNLRSLKIGNVAVLPIALSSKDEETTLRCWDSSRKIGGTGCNQLLQGDPSDYEIPVQARRLDSLALPDPDFIKIDVEHWEFEVLLGAEKLLRRCAPRLLIEVHNTETPVRIREFLGPMGYGFADMKASVPCINHQSEYLWCEFPKGSR